jgi:CelD/BcsL family acetyltransferase involved in cellulose biosynthesis
MKVSLCLPGDLGPPEIARWLDFQRCTHSLSSPFLSPEFAIAFGHRRPDLRIAVIEDGGKVRAFFPFQRHYGGLGRALAYGLADYQGVVHAPGFAWHGTTLLQACGLAAFEFDHLVAEQLAQFAPQSAHVKTSPAADLELGWEGWLARRMADPRLRPRMKKISWRERKLTRDHGEIRFDYDDRNRNNLALLMGWKSAQYRRTGKKDLFSDPWLVGFISEVFDTRTDTFTGRLSTLYARERPVASYLSLRAGPVLAGWFPAYDSEFAIYGVGHLHRLRMLQTAATDGVRCYDMGAGNNDFKETFCDHENRVAAGALHRATALGLARRLQTAPQRMATQIVMENPRLHHMASHGLRRFERLKAMLLSASLRQKQSGGVDGPSEHAIGVREPGK